MTQRVRLYLDDKRMPMDDGAGPWTVVRTLDEAKVLLERGVDEATLDHDLGQCPACTSDVGPENCPHLGTGLDLVRWMALTGNWPRVRPRVHSANRLYGPKMREAIEVLWHVPFRWELHRHAMGCGCTAMSDTRCDLVLVGERRCICACHVAPEARWWGMA